jgi:hypothetical protein
VIGQLEREQIPVTKMLRKHGNNKKVIAFTSKMMELVNAGKSQGEIYKGVQGLARSATKEVMKGKLPPAVWALAFIPVIALGLLSANAGVNDA